MAAAAAEQRAGRPHLAAACQLMRFLSSLDAIPLGTGLGCVERTPPGNQVETGTHLGPSAGPHLELTAPTSLPSVPRGEIATARPASQPETAARREGRGVGQRASRDRPGWRHWGQRCPETLQPPPFTSSTPGRLLPAPLRTEFSSVHELFHFFIILRPPSLSFLPPHPQPPPS